MLNNRRVRRPRYQDCDTSLGPARWQTHIRRTSGIYLSSRRSVPVCAGSDAIAPEVDDWTGRPHDKASTQNHVRDSLELGLASKARGANIGRRN